MRINFEKDKLLFLLLATDIAFITLHILHIYTDLLPDSLYSLAMPRSYSEFFQYTKELWIAIILLAAGIRLRSSLYFSFSALFLYFLVDDSFELHETTGKYLADTLFFQPAFGLRPVDFGEMLVSGAIGLPLLGLIALAYLKSVTATRQVAHILFGLIVLTVFFGVIVDMAEIMVNQPAISRILVIVEDGGEMIVMSIITAFTFGLSRSSTKDSLPG